MRILITNDDGYRSPGLISLVKALAPFGELTIVAPKSPQSGMSMAVTMGYKPIAVKHLDGCKGQDWWYLDGTPASCIKYGLDNVLYPKRPDLVVSGINHGNNAATAAIYSGTLGAAMEGAINGIRSIAVSLDSFADDPDFSAAVKLFPGIVKKLLDNYGPRFGGFYNVNFPNLPASAIKGIRVTRMGMAHWEREYVPYREDFLQSHRHMPSKADLTYVEELEEGEEVVVMSGDFVSNPGNGPYADHLLMREGWITITPHNIDNSDPAEFERLCAII